MDAADAFPRAVLAVLLAAHPALLSLEELTRELDRPLPELSGALDDLRGAGLVHRHGEFVFATRAAVRASDLAG